MKYIITGYYDKQNYGDDLFKSIASDIFSKVEHVIVPINEINNIKSKNDYTHIILFGGETLNDYFLNYLITFTLNNPSIKLYGVGISCNQEYNSSLINRIYIFDHIIFRSNKDYNFFKSYIDCIYCPDIVFTLKPYKIIEKKNKKTVGFFLSQTSISSKDQIKINEYLNTIVLFIKFLINNNYNIALFSMCTNNLTSESDLIINSLVYDLLKEYHNSITIYNSCDNIPKNISNMSYVVCFRFHAHILSIINNIPFISISSTPKVQALLNENNLQNLYVDFNNNNVATLINAHHSLVNNIKNIKSNLLNVYNQCCKLSKNIYYNILNSLLSTKVKTDNTFYLSNSQIKDIHKYINNTYKSYNSNLSSENKAMIITFSLMRSIKNEYTYGLTEKMNNLTIDNLKDDIFWLINDCILNKNLMFYEVANSVLKQHTSNNNYKYNFNYIDQDNYKGLHRSGWSYVVNNLLKYNNSNEDAILCDLYVDRTFHWNNNEYSLLNVIPYVKPWIGFIHHTCETDYSDYNTTNLFQNINFIKSLKLCKGLYVLSDYLKNCLEQLLSQNLIKHVEVYSLCHPTEFNDKQFDIKLFTKNNNKKIIQIGSWLRNLNAINDLDVKQIELLNKRSKFCKPSNKSLNLNLEKCVLKCKDSDIYSYEKNEDDVINNIPHISRDKKCRKVILNKDVRILDFLDNNEYDELLSKNIVFINLINASAVNTIIECIVRCTPIFVNRLPATIEVLGSSYPLFYNKIEDIQSMLTINKITDGFNYLKKLDKTKFKINTFIDKLLDL